mmetsp:Transcript_39836/g.113766  ORF Transcript_39836/g.113766 Transcript_39836/m.113766 type:complete len:360 (+) Transcript_39836:393-1472(+)
MVTKRQTWIFRSWPGLRTRPTACISNATASSRVAASIGWTMITWLAAVRLVPLADSSSDRSSILGLFSSYWNCIRAVRRAQTLPCNERCSMPNSPSAELILRFRSSHCTKHMILQRWSSFWSFCTCLTSASIFDPYFAKRGALSSSVSRPPGVVHIVFWKDLRSMIFFATSPSTARSRAAVFSRSSFHALTTLRSFLAFSLSSSQSQSASRPSTGSARGMPRCARRRVQRCNALLLSDAASASRATRATTSRPGQPSADAGRPGPAVARGPSCASASTDAQLGGGFAGPSSVFVEASSRLKSARSATSLASSAAAFRTPGALAVPKRRVSRSAFAPVVDAPRNRSRPAMAALDSRPMKP